MTAQSYIYSQYDKTRMQQKRTSIESMSKQSQLILFYIIFIYDRLESKNSKKSHIIIKILSLYILCISLPLIMFWRNNGVPLRELYNDNKQNLKMKRICLLPLAVAVMMLSSMAASAQYRGGYGSGGDNYHFGYLTGGVGYTSLQAAVPDFTPKGGVGGFVGLGYEFRNNGLWLSVGAQFGFHRSKAEITDMQTNDLNGYDQQGKEITLHYDLTEKDQQRWTFVDIPIMVGYYFHGFHIGIGPKVGYALSSKVRSEGTYNITATYNLYNGVMADMPNHNYTNYEYSSDGKANLNPLISIVGEVSYDVLSTVSTRSTLCNILRVGFYFEYGLNNLVSPNSSNQRIEIIDNDATKVKVNPYLASGLTESHRVVPFFTGLKITYLIGGSKTVRYGGYHKGCHCYN